MTLWAVPLLALITAVLPPLPPIHNVTVGNSVWTAFDNTHRGILATSVWPITVSVDEPIPQTAVHAAVRICRYYTEHRIISTIAVHLCSPCEEGVVGKAEWHNPGNITVWVAAIDDTFGVVFHYISQAAGRLWAVGVEQGAALNNPNSLARRACVTDQDCTSDHRCHEIDRRLPHECTNHYTSFWFNLAILFIVLGVLGVSVLFLNGPPQ